MFDRVIFRLTLNVGASHPYAQQLVTGDFNGDGRVDVLIPQGLGVGTAAVPVRGFLGGPGGIFTESAALFGPAGSPLAVNPTRSLAADFNGDGRTDVLLLDHGYDAPPYPGGFSQLLLSDNGGLRLADTSIADAQRFTHGGAVGDIDGDGDLDAVLFNLNESSGHAIQILVNNGGGSLDDEGTRAPLYYQTPVYRAGSTWGALFDADGDGDKDLLVGTWNASTLPTQIFANDGTGSFARATPWNLPASGVAKAVVLQALPFDLNGDALPDLVLAITDGGAEGTDFYNVSYLQFLVNRGGGVFVDETATRLPQSLSPLAAASGSWPKFLQATDIDLDGDTDLIVWRNYPSSPAASFELNDGTGKFTPTGNIDYLALTTADLNGDNIPELIAVMANELRVIANDLAPFGGGAMAMTRGSISTTVLADPYTGPVAGLRYQFLGSDQGEAVVGTPGADFINLLGGNDAAQGGAGRDVLDGGIGSNFLTGGPDSDVFFLDGRGGTTTWGTITDWQPGEQLSIWGYRPGVSVLNWVASAGAEGYKGLTLHADLDGNGVIETSVTWSGLTSQSQLPTPSQFDNLLWFT